MEPPLHNLEIEIDAIGEVFYNPAQFGNGFIELWRPENFYDFRNRVIAQGISDVHTQGIAPDAANVIQHLSESGALQKAGGADFILGLFRDRGNPNFKSDLQKIAELAEKRRLRERVTRMDWSAPLPEIRHAFEQSIPQAPESLQFIEAQKLATDPSERPPDIIKDLLPPESVLMLYGEPGTGKTLLALHLAIYLAAGRPWHHLQITQPHRVAYLALEGGYWTLRDRLNTLMDKDILAPEDEFYLCPTSAIDILDPATFGGLVAELERIQPDVIFVDPLRKAHHEEENDNGAMELVLSRLRSLITGNKRSLIIIHHSNKSKESARGASAILGDVDTSLKLEWKSPGSYDGIRVLRAEKVRHGPTPPPLFLALDPESLTFTATERGSDGIIIQILEVNGGSIDSKPKLQKAIQDETGNGRTWAYQRINEAIDAEIIEVSDTGKIHLNRPPSVRPQLSTDGTDGGK